MVKGQLTGCGQHWYTSFLFNLVVAFKLWYIYNQIYASGKRMTINIPGLYILARLGGVSTYW